MNWYYRDSGLLWVSLSYCTRGRGTEDSSRTCFWGYQIYMASMPGMIFTLCELVRMSMRVCDFYYEKAHNKLMLFYVCCFVGWSFWVIQDRAISSCKWYWCKFADLDVNMKLWTEICPSCIECMLKCLFKLGLSLISMTRRSSLCGLVSQPHSKGCMPFLGHCHKWAWRKGYRCASVVILNTIVDKF